jgi:hypothetical protein
MVNTNLLGVLYVHASDGKSSTSNGVVIPHVNEGDDVFIRTSAYAPTNAGFVDSDGAGRCSFAGWRLC